MSMETRTISVNTQQKMLEESIDREIEAIKRAQKAEERADKEKARADEYRAWARKWAWIVSLITAELATAAIIISVLRL